jgi:hypothetical protein
MAAGGWNPHRTVASYFGTEVDVTKVIFLAKGVRKIVGKH